MAVYLGVVVPGEIKLQLNPFAVALRDALHVLGSRTSHSTSRPTPGLQSGRISEHVPKS